MSVAIWWVALTVIVFASFMLYSYVRYPALNSDHAITILMCQTFQLPHDFYYWGQDRYGSIVPLLSQIPIRAGADAAISVSMVHFIILLAGYFAVRSLIQSRILQLIVAVIWFLPPTRMLELVQFWPGLSYSFIFIAIAFFRLASKTISFKSYFYFFIACTGMSIACWISDLAAISTLSLIVVSVLYEFFLKSISFSRVAIIKGSIALVVLLAACLFISFAKANADSHFQYAQFASFSHVCNSISVLAFTLFDLLLFRGNEPFTSIYCYGILSVVAILLLRGRVWLKVLLQHWLMLFFLLDFVLVLGAVVCSSHVADNLVQRRFFNASYISGMVLLILLIDNWIAQSKSFRGIVVQVTLLVTVAIGGLGSYYHHACVWPGTLTPRIVTAGEFGALGKVGIAGNYWNTYIYSCTNPEQIKALPYYMPAARDKNAAAAFFEQPRLLVVRDMWFNDFPDTIDFHLHTLIKTGQPFHMADCDVCDYQLKENK
ncbi:MAG: hypothetical protein ACKVOR_12720 [Flavobacteriales bacterium]